MEKITLTPYEAETLFIEATRYAIGRATYASSETAKIVNAHLGELTPKACWLIAREIRDHDEIRDKSHIYYEMDVKPWVDMLPELDVRARELRE